VTAVRQPSSEPASEVVLRTAEDVHAYVAKICFKTGPPALVGVELEWTIHHDADPARPLDPAVLRTALDSHAPPTLDPDGPHQTLPSAARSPSNRAARWRSPPRPTLLWRACTPPPTPTSATSLTGSRAGLTLGAAGIDPHRPPRRLLRTPGTTRWPTPSRGPVLRARS
jgi:hypothetical protein